MQDFEIIDFSRGLTAEDFATILDLDSVKWPDQEETLKFGSMKESTYN